VLPVSSANVPAHSLADAAASVLILLNCVPGTLMTRCPCRLSRQRYDPVTTGLGSLLVTGYCVVAHQQSVGEALNIAACATVLGMVGGPWHCLAVVMTVMTGMMVSATQHCWPSG
jgi:hypothetical protein